MAFNIKKYKGSHIRTCWKFGETGPEVECDILVIDQERLVHSIYFMFGAILLLHIPLAYISNGSTLV